jgi:hypothetical protein
MKLYVLIAAAAVLIAAHVAVYKPKKKEEKMHELIPGKIIFIPVSK